jgi:hypothetical protein
MNILNKKIQHKSFAILLLLALVVGTFAALQSIPNASAREYKNYAVIDAIPDPVGVGQDVLIRAGILRPLGSVLLGWEGVTVTVTHPDNHTETLGPIRTDSTGVSFVRYVPDQVGTYLLQSHFPQQNATSSWNDAESGNRINEGDVMLAADSEVIELVVQQDPLPDYPGHALPSEYWSRPIDPQLREWFSISGNWVERPANSLAYYNMDAPETAHVLWANELTTGGLMGGAYGDNIPVSAEAGDAYEGKFPGSVVLNGILYYQRTDTRSEQAPAIIAVNMHTGEEWLYKNNTVLSFGQILYFNSYNYDGAFSYIWSTDRSGTWTAYDPFTGNQQMQFINVPSGYRTFGPSGEILIYQIDYAHGWMALWNSTDCGLQLQDKAAPGYGSWGNSAHGRVLDASVSRAYSWNVTIPSGLQAQASFGTPTIKVHNDERLVAIWYNQSIVRTWALPLDTIEFTNSVENTQSISTIFDKTWNAPDEWETGANTIHYTGASNELEGGVIAVWDKELQQHYGFSQENGNYLWTTHSEFYSDAYGWGNAEHTWYFAYGKLFSVGLGGIVYAYDQATGETAWEYVMDDAYNEPVTGQNWWGWITLIADEKVYVGTVEHSAEQPLPRGAPQICINASDGTEIWRVNGMFRDTRWGGNGVIGDSIIATMDTYDQRVYGIGKGPSQTTVVQPTTSIADGSQMIIQGSVNDISPGLSDYAITARFPNGVPAVSDESMSNWMLYVWKQFEYPTSATGVPVTVSVIDANGNYRTIGTTTSDSTGHYSLAWTPDISGTYQVYVTFEGSAAYYGSSASTTFVAEEAHATMAPEPTPAEGVADQYFLPAIVGLIILVIVGFAATILLLRRP